MEKDSEFDENPLKGFQFLDMVNVPNQEEVKEEQEEEDNLKNIKKEVKSKTPKKVEKQIDGEEEENTSNKQNLDDETDDLEESDVEETEDVEEEQQFIPIIQHFASKGILETIDDIEDSEEGFEKAIDKTIETRVEKKIKDRLGILGEEGERFLEFVEQGGDPKQFIELYYNPVSWQDYKLKDDDVEAQKMVIRQSLSLDEDYTNEEIEEIITEWEDLNSLSKHSKKHLSRLQKIENEQKEYEQTQLKEKDKQRKQAIDKYWNDFKDNLYKKEDVKGFKISSKEKDDLWNFMTKVDKKTGKTAYQLAIEKESDANLLFAYQAMKGFDINKLEKQVKTKVVSDLSKKLKNIKTTDSRNKMKSGQSEDFSNERESNSSFSAWKNYL